MDFYLSHSAVLYGLVEHVCSHTGFVEFVSAAPAIEPHYLPNPLPLTWFGLGANQTNEPLETSQIPSIEANIS